MLTIASEGFPEFARFFNHSHLWKLQSIITAGCSAIELLRKMRPTHHLKRCVRGAQDDFYNRRSMKGQAQPPGLKGDACAMLVAACMTG